MPKPLRNRTPKKYVVISHSSYGKALSGTRIYYEGGKPPRLGKDGRIAFGKSLLEILRNKFGEKFRWIITKETDSIDPVRGIVNVRISQKMLGRMYGDKFERIREVQIDIVQRRLFRAFPTYFTTSPPSVYVPGSVAKVLSRDAVSKLSSEDKDALNKVLPEFLKTEAMSLLAIRAVE